MQCVHSFSNIPDSGKLLTGGHQLALEIISTHADIVHVLSSEHNYTSLESVGLYNCTRLASARDLFRKELSQNWRKLQHNKAELLLQGSLDNTLKWQPHHVTKRSSREGDQDSDCVLNGRCSGQEDEWFTEYVSPLPTN